MSDEKHTNEADRARAPAAELAAIRAATSTAWLEGPSAEARKSWPGAMKRYLDEEKRRRFALEPWDEVNLALPDPDFVSEIDSRIADKAHRLGRAALNDLELMLNLRSHAREAVCMNGFKAYFKGEDGANWEAQVLAFQLVGDSALATLLRVAGELLGKAGPTKRRRAREEVAQALRLSDEGADLPEGASEPDALQELTRAFIHQTNSPSPVARFIRRHVRELELPKA